MTIKTSEVMKDFTGEPLMSGETPITVGLALSNILVAAGEGGKMKLYTLAQKAFSDKSIDLDDADLALVKKAVDNTNIYSNIVTGFLLLLLEGTKASQ